MATFVVLAASPSFAAEPLKAAMTVSKVVVTPEGQENLVPAETAKPGDVLVYEATYTNVGSATLGGVRPVVPVPPGMTYIADSAVPTATAWTADGKTYQALSDSNDKAPAAEKIRGLQWSAKDLATGDERTVSLRVRMTDNTEPTSSAQ